MRKQSLLSLLCLLFVGGLAAQSVSLSGKVTEEGGGEPVLFGAVALYQDGKLKNGTETDFDGNYNFSNLEPGIYDVEFSLLGMQTLRIVGVIIFGGSAARVDAELISSVIASDEVIIQPYKATRLEREYTDGTLTSEQIRNLPTRDISQHGIATSVDSDNKSENTRGNSAIAKGATYNLVRSYIARNRLPRSEEVRSEEMINYFSYDYPQAVEEQPFSVQSELGVCPWNTDHLLLSIGLQGEQKTAAENTGSNLTFLIDVSSSMWMNKRLPLIKSSILYLLDELKEEDRIAIVIYSGVVDLLLPSTLVSERVTILNALDRLSAGGSVALDGGIELAYETAKSHYHVSGNNRVVLATDGDFNLSANHPDSLEVLVARGKDNGIFLTALGFGMNNFNDKRLERLANIGGGRHAYIDTQTEAEKLFSSELVTSLAPIAKDVKLQLRFNPREVASYRLIGYENRWLNKEDFTDDSKEVGDIGPGHSVTAIYEIIPAQADITTIDIGRLKLRYRTPEGRRGKLLKHQLASQIKDNTSDNFRWAAAVMAYSLLLQDSEYKASCSYQLVQELGESARGEDVYGWRAAFLKQVSQTEELVNGIGQR